MPWPYYYEWSEVLLLTHLLANWLLGALALWIVAQIIPGIVLRGFGTAMFATVMIAIVNSTIGLVLKFLTLPLTLLTLGLFLLVIDALLLKLASLFVPGFEVRGFLAAFVGSLVLAILSSALRQLVFS
jgi:putative membrane protein